MCCLIFEIVYDSGFLCYLKKCKMYTGKMCLELMEKYQNVHKI